MATAPRKGVVPDIEAGLPSPSSSPTPESSKPTPVSVAPSSKSPEEEANKVLQRAFGPISPSAKKATEKGGRKHRTRKHKKHARKTKKHLRRK